MNKHDKTNDTCILFFIKYPEKKRVKQRLAQNISEDIVLDLYRCFIYDTLSVLNKLKTPFIICFHPEHTQKQLQNWLGQSYTYLAQRGKNLGQRMKNAFQDTFNQGFRRVVLIGSDSPDLPHIYIKNALTFLQECDIVIGPTTDGGYYLIGFKDTRFFPEIFDQINWSTPTVFQETLTRCTKQKLTITLLPLWSDVDTLNDLNNLIARNKKTDFQYSHTYSYLLQHKELFQE